MRDDRLTTVLLVAVAASLVCGGTAGLLGALLWTSVASLETHPEPPRDPADPWEEAAGAPGPLTRGPGGDVRGVLDEEAPEAFHRHAVPEDAIGLRVRLEGDAPLELALHFSEVPPADDAWDHEYEESLLAHDVVLSRHAHTEFVDGDLVVRVSTEGHGPHAADVHYRLRVEPIAAERSARLAAGESASGRTTRLGAHAWYAVVEVPPGTSALRLDLADTSHDLDLLAGFGRPPRSADDAASARSLVGSEALVLRDEDLDGALRAGGPLHVAVVDPSEYDWDVGFRLVSTLGEAPPEELTRLPVLQAPTDPRSLALAAVVEVVAGDGSGSGTLVRADGLVLTARHVVAPVLGAGPDWPERGDLDGLAPVVVALTLDPGGGATDLFRGRVVAEDAALDVALVEIVSGLRGGPLPPGYAFPALPLFPEWRPRHGDPVTTIGFPASAGFGSRVPVLLSAGVVAGFEGPPDRRLVKTDAFIGHGSSGGAVLDGEHRLVAVPVTLQGDYEGRQTLGYCVPVSRLPESFRARIRDGK